MSSVVRFEAILARALNKTKVNRPDDKTQIVQEAAPKQTWQAHKSDATRNHILETTLLCLAELPYSEITTGKISNRAGVSRGGMHYHFPTRIDLLRGAVDHLYKRRLSTYQSDLTNIPAGSDIVDHLVDTQWKHLNEADFAAYMELVLAARSDSNLKSELGPHYRRFLQGWYDFSEATFGWRQSAPEVRTLGNLIQHLMEGMAYGRIANQLDDSEVGELLAYIKSLVRQGLAIGQN